MPTDTPDQQITMPVDADSADNPVAFVAAVGDIEPRLVREYTTEADRTARMLVLGTNDISSLSAPAVGVPRIEAWNGANHISAYTRGLWNYIRKPADETVNNSTALQNDDDLVVALPAAGTFQFELDLLYAASTVADIKFAFTWPALAQAAWNAMGLATTATTSTGDITVATISASGSSVAFGGVAAGSPIPLRIFGDIVMGGTAGNLQLQWAQQNLEVSNALVVSRSNMRVWRVA